MATEQELQDQVTALQAEVENLTTERDLIKASIVDKDAARDVQLAAATAEKDRLVGEAQQAAAEDDAVAQAKIGKLQAQVDALKKKTPAAEGVVLAGVPHDIVRQERAVDLVSAHRARFVEDDDICLVVKKS